MEGMGGGGWGGGGGGSVDNVVGPETDVSDIQILHTGMHHGED